MKAKPYGPVYQSGYLSMEMEFPYPGVTKGEVGVQVSEDGRIWVCLDGQALLRFVPERVAVRKKWRKV